MTVRKLVILDYGSGNLRSAQRALEHVGAHVEVTGGRRRQAHADLVIHELRAWGRTDRMEPEAAQAAQATRTVAEQAPHRPMEAGRV